MNSASPLSLDAGIAADGRATGLMSARAIFCSRAAWLDSEECVRAAGFIGADEFCALLSLLGSTADGGVALTVSAGGTAAGCGELAEVEIGEVDALGFGVLGFGVLWLGEEFALGEGDGSDGFAFDAELAAVSVPLAGAGAGWAVVGAVV
ncbi:MAG: hypothetical protein WA609_07515 [Terriglobales bacterium]